MFCILRVVNGEAAARVCDRTHKIFRSTCIYIVWHTSDVCQGVGSYANLSCDCRIIENHQRNDFVSVSYLFRLFLSLSVIRYPSKEFNRKIEFHPFSVEECKKRWRSLRDAFMKQYKLFQRGDTSIKKRWLFYEQMEFLAPYFDA